MKSKEFLIGLGVAGIGIIIAGYATGISIFNSVGGAFFGTAVGGLLTAFSNNDVLDTIRRSLKTDLDAIQISLQAEFKSNALELERFRKKWHCYHITKKNKKFVWHYSEIDFQKTPSQGVLFSEVIQTDVDGKEKLYNLIAGMRDNRLIMFMNGIETKEDTMIAVFPYAGRGFSSTNGGLRLYVTWDNSDSISRTIISAEPINGYTQIGDITNDETKKMLDEKWEELFNLTDVLIPVCPKPVSKN